MTTSTRALSASTIPSWSPLYHMPPHIFHKAKRITLLLSVEPGITERLIPKPLEQAGDFIWFSMLDMGEVEDHTDEEGYISVHNFSINIPVRYNDKTGKYCSVEYIDSGMGLTVGRELMAYPKKDAGFTWRENNGVIEVAVCRLGKPIAHFRATPHEKGSGTDINWTRDFGTPHLDDNSFHVRHLAHEHGSSPVLAQVERTVLKNHQIHSTVTADASIEFVGTANDPFDLLGDFKVLAARIDNEDFELFDNEIVGTEDL